MYLNHIIYITLIIYVDHILKFKKFFSNFFVYIKKKNKCYQKTYQIIFISFFLYIKNGKQILSKAQGKIPKRST